MPLPSTDVKGRLTGASWSVKEASSDGEDRTSRNKTQAFRRRKWSFTRASFGGGIRHTTSTLHPPYPNCYPSCHCLHSEATRGNRPGSNGCRKHSRPDRRTWPVTQAERKRRRRTRPLASTQRNNGGAHQNLIRETPTATPGGVTQHKLLSP